ncbi:plasmid recombination protein [Acetobacter thailandicus]|nr:plasmid recombination protein [Acetobacter thailandicus]
MSNFAIFRLEKLHTEAQIKAASAHMLRERETPNADSARADQNRRIIGADLSPSDAVQRRLEGVKVRSNAVRALEVLATMSPEWTKTATPEQIDQWAATSTDWLKEQFGADNVVSLTLHMDETTPHLTGFVVPMKDGKLTAKQLVRGPAHLREMQSDYAKRMEPFGLTRGVAGSKAKHEKVKRFYGALERETPEITSPTIGTPPLLGREAWAKAQNERIAAELMHPLEQLAAEAKLSPIYRTQANAAKATANSERRKREDAEKRAAEAEKVAEAAINRAKRTAVTQIRKAEAAQKEAEIQEQSAREELILRRQQLDAERTARADELRSMDIVSVMHGLGLKPDPKDQKQWKDEEGRFRITIEGRKFYDHNASKGGGGAIDLVMHAMGSDYQGALSWLASMYGKGFAASEVRASASEQVEKATKKRPAFTFPPPPNDAQQQKIRDYLTRRGIKISDKWPQNIRLDGRGNVGFLTATDSKTCVGMELKGTNPDRPFTGLALGSSREGCFRVAQGLQKGRKPDLVITESAIDALSFLQLPDTDQKYPNGVVVVSTAGVRATVNERIHSLLPEADRVLIAYDNDEAGRAFGAKLARAIRNIFEGVIHFFQPPEGCKDINDMLQSKKATCQVLEKQNEKVEDSVTSWSYGPSI